MVKVLNRVTDKDHRRLDVVLQRCVIYHEDRIWFLCKVLDWVEVCMLREKNANKYWAFRKALMKQINDMRKEM